MSGRGCSYLRAHGEAETRSQPTRQAAGLLLLTSDLQDVRAADQPPIVHVAEPALHAGGNTTVPRCSPLLRPCRSAAAVGHARSGRDVLLSVPAI